MEPAEWCVNLTVGPRTRVRGVPMVVSGSLLVFGAITFVLPKGSIWTKYEKPVTSASESAVDDGDEEEDPGSPPGWSGGGRRAAEEDEDEVEDEDGDEDEGEDEEDCERWEGRRT